MKANMVKLIIFPIRKLKKLPGKSCTGMCRIKSILSATGNQTHMVNQFRIMARSQSLETIFKNISIWSLAVIPTAMKSNINKKFLENTFINQKQ